MHPMYGDFRDCLLWGEQHYDPTIIPLLSHAHLNEPHLNLLNITILGVATTKKNILPSGKLT